MQRGVEEGTFVSCVGEELHSKRSRSSPLHWAVLCFTLWSDQSTSVFHPGFQRTKGVFPVE